MLYIRHKVEVDALTKLDHLSQALSQGMYASLNFVKNIIKMNSDPNKIQSSKIGEAEINLNKMNIKLKEKIKKINLSEKKVLVKMLSTPGKIFSRLEIGKIANITKERSIDVMITRLRKKIEIDPKNPKFLQTIRGSGYVLWVK